MSRNNQAADFEGTRGTVILGSEEDQGSLSLEGLVLCVFEGGQLQTEVSLSDFGQLKLTFGSASDNDIVISSQSGIVSRYHGSIMVGSGGCTIIDEGSTNGLYFNGVKKPHSIVTPKDVVTIGSGRSDRYDSIVIMLRYESSKWKEYDLSTLSRATIGRSHDNSINLPYPAVSAHHATLERSSSGQWMVRDNGSFNGTYVGGVPVVGPTVLHNGDIIIVANITLVYTGEKILVPAVSSGVEVVAQNLYQIRKNRGKEIVTNDDISLKIGKGEFVAIVGGSGSGKTTLLNELNGSEPAASGRVYVDGIDLYANYGQLKNTIGYVPQQDIVYDDLRLIDMLGYAAELRMPPDTTKAEREERAKEVLDMLELTPFAQNYIGKLSGGQKKRASIAVELLADPKLLFLDEPTSGLDPGIEKNLMQKLANMASEGRTIILVTHTTLNLDLCDKVVFLAPGGKLCYAGSPSGALSYFGIDDFVEAYEVVSADPDGWQRSYKTGAGASQALGSSSGGGKATAKKNPSFIRQLSTLSRRYLKLLLNDRQRLALLILQAPILSALICLVAGEDCFTIYEETQSCLFALSCAAFWVGILDSIQEICKERVILRREYAGGLNLVAYVLSKVLVLGALCILQSLLLAGVFCAIEGVPDETLINPYFELFVTVFMTTFSAMCLGLMVSALFKNADRAIAMAPILIMPQILFSGLIFKLEGMAENISIFVNCRWGMEAFGTTANLNDLDLKIYKNDDIPDGMIEHEFESAFEYTIEHLTASWGILGIFCIVCLGLCVVALKATMRK